MGHGVQGPYLTGREPPAAVQADVLVGVPERRDDGVPVGRLLGEPKHLAAGVIVVEELQHETARLMQRDGVHLAERSVVGDYRLAARMRAARRAEPGVRREQLPQPPRTRARRAGTRTGRAAPAISARASRRAMRSIDGLLSHHAAPRSPDGRPLLPGRRRQEAALARGGLQRSCRRSALAANEPERLELSAGSRPRRRSCRRLSATRELTFCCVSSCVGSAALRIGMPSNLRAIEST